jgi:hypothetical protein
VFGTGVGSDGKALADGEIDPHYEITVNPDGLGDDAIVQDSTVFPIVTGPWLPNTEVCKWIGPRFETSAAAAGDYVYTTTLDLTGFDPATVVLAGQWSSDNVGLDMNLNGASLGIGNGAQFGGYTSFKITSGFKEGLNTLDFILNNASAGYTGLRVNSLRAGGVRSGPRPRPSLEIAKTGSQIRLSWPATATGFSLIGADTLTSPTWTPVNEPVVQEGGLNKVTVSTAGTARFFMLME